jgi:hypothetical protein
VGALAGTGGIDAGHFGQQPGVRGVDPLQMLLGSSGHSIFITKIFINLII